MSGKSDLVPARVQGGVLGAGSVVTRVRVRIDT